MFRIVKIEGAKTLKVSNEKLHTEIGRQKIEINFLKKFLRSWRNKRSHPLHETRLGHFGMPAMRSSDGQPCTALLSTQR